MRCLPTASLLSYGAASPVLWIGTDAKKHKDKIKTAACAAGSSWTMRDADKLPAFTTVYISITHSSCIHHVMTMAHL
jgi:hypothetical protein